MANNENSKKFEEEYFGSDVFLVKFHNIDVLL